MAQARFVAEGALRGRLYRIDASPAGLMLLLRLPDDARDEQMVQELAAHGIDALSLSSHHAGLNRQQGLLLSFAGFSEDDLGKAAAKLIEVLS